MLCSLALSLHPLVDVLPALLASFATATLR